MRWLGVFLFLVFVFVPIVSADTYLYCVDSDGGQTANTFGHVDYSYVSIPQQHEIMQVNDSCQTGTLLTEHYCGGSNPVWTINSSTIDCVSQGYTGCSNGACYGSASCSDGVRNGQETDVDCGGFTCDACGAGDQCMLSSDCESSVCDGGICLALPEEPIPTFEVAIGPRNPGNHVWNLGDNPNNTMMQLVLTARNAPVRVEFISIHASGTGDDLQGIRRVYLAEDMNLDGRYTPNEYQWTRGTYNHDDGSFSMRLMPAMELNGTKNESVTLLIVYELSSLVGIGQTFTVQVAPVYARALNGTYVGIDLSTNASFRTTKTINSSYTPPSCHVNGVRDFDESGVDCGGAYCPACTYIDHCVNGVRDSDEQDIDCGGSCPTCIPDVCLPQESCNPLNPPLCDAVTRSVSICISGFWSNVAGGYDLYCDDPRVCTPGTFLCDHQQHGVRECLLNGQWGDNVILDSLYAMHCAHEGCESGESYCFENSLYVCGTNNEWATSATPRASCQQQVCDWGQMMCDFARETVTQCILRDPRDPTSAYWNTLEVQVIPADEEGPEQRFDPFDLYCMPVSSLCDEGSRRCDFERKMVQTCIEGGWDTSEDTSLYNVMCAGRECNAEEFLCNPFEETVAFCTAEGSWGADATTDYTRLCESSDITPSVDTTTNVPYATGGRRVIVGSVHNNTIVAYRFLAPSPEVQNEMSISFLRSPWTAWILILFLVGTTAYFGLKYRACTLGGSLGTSNKKAKK